MTLFPSPRLRFVARVLQYLAIQFAMLYLSSHHALVTPAFIYQGF